MCGIFGYVGHGNDGAEKILNGLKTLEYRGYDSWGVAIERSSKILVEKHVGKIGEAQLKDTAWPTQLGLGHTRWATHGGVTVQNAHPHLSSDGKFAVVHNGIIENFQELKDQLVARGVVFTSETDTEVFIQLLTENTRSYPPAVAFQKTFSAIQGLNAFVVLSLVDHKLYAVRKGSPLVIGKGKDGYYLASDAAALARHASQVFFIEDQQLVELSDTICHVSDLQTGQQVIPNWQPHHFTKEELTKGSYAHFLLKEIHQQPTVLQAILTSLDTQLTNYAKKLPNDDFFVGCGSAFHACLTASYFFPLIAKQLVRALPASEFTTTRELLTPDQFVTFVSQSGETIDVIEHLSFLKDKGVPFGALVNRLGSTLERTSTDKLLLPAGVEQAVLATKSYTAMVAVLFLLAHAKVGTLERGKKLLMETISAIQKVLVPSYEKEYLLPLATKLQSATQIFVIGRGNSYPVALEAALKLKEVTYIHTEGFAGGELKHGVIALITPDTPCIVFAPDDEESSAVLSNAQELKSRGAYIIGIGPHSKPVFDSFLPVETHGLLSAVSLAVPIQLLAYHLAVLRGNDPDKPRNLAKSVTVK